MMLRPMGSKLLPLRRAAAALGWVGAVLAGWALSALSGGVGWAQAQGAVQPVLPATVTISTNNTPSDRKALLALSQEAFRRLGMGFHLVSLPSERSLLAANAGEVGGEGLRVAGLEDSYPNLVRVPEAYIGIRFVAFSRDPAISLPAGWASLGPYRVAHITGWKLFETQAGVARSVVRVDQAEQLFEMLAGGRIDLALYTLTDGRALVKRLGLAGVSPVLPALREMDMFLYLHRQHAALAPELARTLKLMKADGSHQRILATLPAD